MAKKKDTGSLKLAKPEVPADPVAMRRAAAILEVAIPTGDNADVALLGVLRTRIQKLIKDKTHILCMVCDERSTEQTPFCPFCGDEGEVVDDQTQSESATLPEVTAPVEQSKELTVAQDKDAKKATKPSKAKPVKEEITVAADVSADMSALDAELEACLQKIVAYTHETIGATYEIGLILKQINDRTMYRARGFDSFRKFADAVLPMSRQTAYQLKDLVEQFDRKTFEEVGFRKLRAIASLVGESHDEAMEAARAGATATELEAMAAKAKKTRPALTSGSGADTPKKAAAPAPETNHKVTLLTKMDDKPREVTLLSQKTGKPLSSAGKVTYQVPDAYGDIELAEGVHMRVALRIVGKDIVGFTVQYVRAAEAAE